MRGQQAGQHGPAGATPRASGLKLALSQASRATPAKPIDQAQHARAVGRSFSQTHATSAPNSGTVALRMADSPVVMDSSAKAKQHERNAPN